MSRNAAVVTLVAILPVLAVPSLGEERWDWLNLNDTSVSCVTVAPGDSSLIVAGGSQLNVSHDGGLTWASNSTVSTVWCIAFGSTKSLAFATTWGSGIYKSTDDCATWTPSNNGLTNGVVKSICVSPADDQVVLAAAEDGLLKSTDGGLNWTMVKPGLNASAVAFSPLRPQVAYLGSWGSGMWKSEDTGDNWTAIGLGALPDGGACYGIALDPADDRIVYAVFQGGGVWASFDDGGTWKHLEPGFEGFAVAPDGNRPGFIYGLGGWTYPQRSGCYGGAAGWTAMSASWNPAWFARYIAVDPNDSSRVYACGSGGLYRWVVDVTPPNPAGTLSATFAGNAIQLSWGPSGSADCTGYWIYKRSDGGSYPLTPTFTINDRATTSFSDTSVTAGAAYYYRVAASDAAQNTSPLSNEAGSQVAASYDLDVTYIARLPRDCRFYSVEYPDNIPTLRAGTENDKRWPAFGETVTFEAHVVNKGTATTPPANCRWKINGQVIGTGTVAGVGPGQEGTATVDWPWNIDRLDTDHSDQTLTFEIDYDNQIPETFESNNTRTDYFEGASLFIYVDQNIYDAFNGRINLAGTRSFEDWIQAQCQAMNANFARSTYPLAPNGCLERVRIDKIVVGPAPTENDGTADGRWQFTGDAGYAVYADRVDGGLVHELMHQLGVIDLYQMPVTPPHNQVVTPDGLPCGMGFGFGRAGIMGGGDIAPHTSGSSQTMPEYCAAHDVLGLNANCGYKRGYYGDYLFDVPALNWIVVKDSAGKNAAGANIEVYQGGFGQMSGTPVASGVTDASGKFLLPNRQPTRTITTATGHTLAPNPFGTTNVVGGNATLLIEMSRPGGDFDYRFINIIDFNMAYWAGNKDSWTQTINSRLASNVLPRITTLNAAIETTSAKLTWPTVAGASGYRIYRASSYLNRADDPTHTYENWVFRPLATVTTTQYTDTTRSETCRYAVTPISGATEGPLSNRVFSPNLINPWGVAILPDNRRVILDPQNGFAFLQQTADGVYIANTGSEHNHVENSRFIAIDRRLNRMLTAHPSDWYGGPQSIRVTDLEGNLDGLWDIGMQGSGPRQFDNPGGVAVDDQSRIYAVDIGNARIQILGSDGSFITAYGSSGSGEGQFDNPQGIAITAEHVIYVCDQGNHRVQLLRFQPTDNTVSYLGMLTGKALQQPTCVAVATDGSVFVTDRQVNTVEVFDSFGAWRQTISTAQAPYSGSLAGPTGIAIDGDGQIVVCDTNNRRVVTVAPAALPPNADFNHDGKVDRGDLALFLPCATGPDIPYDPGHLPTSCTLPADSKGILQADFDRDGDVDLTDFGTLQRSYAGAGVTP